MDKWQATFDYEINQLRKLGAEVVEDLPPGEHVILCTEVLKEKHGPTSEIKSYWIWIVTGGTNKSKELITLKLFWQLLKCLQYASYW